MSFDTLRADFQQMIANNKFREALAFLNLHVTDMAGQGDISEFRGRLADFERLETDGLINGSERDAKLNKLRRDLRNLGERLLGATLPANGELKGDTSSGTRIGAQENTDEFAPTTKEQESQGKTSRIPKLVITATLVIVVGALILWAIKAFFAPSRISAETFYKEWSANPTSLMNRYVGAVMYGKAEVELKNWEASTFYQLKNPLVLADEKLRRKQGLITLLGDRNVIKPAAGTIAKFEGTIASVTEFLGVELRGVTIEFE